MPLAIIIPKKDCAQFQRANLLLAAAGEEVAEACAEAHERRLADHRLRQTARGRHRRSVGHRTRHRCLSRAIQTLRDVNSPL